jgi:hypothetical protein
LNGRAKVVIDPALLRALLQALAEAAPFSPDFYTATYRDVAEAHTAGRIPDLHRHYVMSGFLEGRLGACPDVDDAFYLARYPDVARAIARGEVASARDHYVRAGAAEGRVPNPALRSMVDAWMELLRGDSALNG